MNMPCVVVPFPLSGTGYPERKKGKYSSFIMQHKALFPPEKQTNGVHMYSARAGIDKEDLELVWGLNLFLYTSHPNVNLEISRNTHFFKSDFP